MPNRFILLLATLITMTSNVIAQDFMLTREANFMSDSDEISLMRMPYFSSGRYGKGLLWDFSELSASKRAFNIWHQVDTVGRHLQLTDRDITYYQNAKDTLFIVCRESPLYKITYSQPILSMSYPFAYGDSISAPFSGFSNALTVDSALLRKYQEGFKTVEHIVRNEALEDKIKGSPYCAFIMGNFWSINICKGDSLFLYYGTHKPKERNKLIIGKDKKEGIEIFTLLHYTIKDDKRVLNNRFFPFQHYILICDSCHKRFEWDNFTKYVGSSNIEYLNKIIANYLLFIFENCMINGLE